MTSATSVEAPPRATHLVDLDCRRCGLCRGRRRVVPAEGHPAARLFLVGEAPGPEEDAAGRPFIGRAGRILRRCLDRAGVPPQAVWITNAVKCFPYTADGARRRIRRPAPAEAAACLPWLAKEVATRDPPILVAVGATALEQLTGRRGLRLADVRGRPVPARAELGGRPVLATFHPGALRYGHGSEEALVADLRAAWRTVDARDGAA